MPVLRIEIATQHLWAETGQNAERTPGEDCDTDTRVTGQACSARATAGILCL